MGQRGRTDREKPATALTGHRETARSLEEPAVAPHRLACRRRENDPGSACTRGGRTRTRELDTRRNYGTPLRKFLGIAVLYQRFTFEAKGWTSVPLMWLRGSVCEALRTLRTRRRGDTEPQRPGPHSTSKSIHCDAERALAPASTSLMTISST